MSRPLAAVALALSLGGCAASRPALAPADERLLDEVQRAAFRYFWEETNPANGLTKDRARNFEEKDDYTVASVAASGYMLLALGIGEARGWITREQAYERALAALRHFRDVQPHVRGWYYHFVDMRTGERAWSSELSSIDTALFLGGALFIGRRFPGTEVERLASDIYERVDFEWMMTDGGAKPQERRLSMGWKPEDGFLPYRWDSYCEHMILYILGLGSPGKALPPESWDAWARPKGSYAGYETFSVGPLFTHQYSHMFIDFRGIRDRYADYFQSSVDATLANRRFCIDKSAEYATYGPDSWGITASDGPDGYKAYGAPPGHADHDGTVAPTAAGGSLPFTPEHSLRALRYMKEAYGGRLWGRYGLTDAYNSDPRWRHRFNAGGLWRSPDVIGIDQGTILAMAENLRTGLVWRTFMGDPRVRRGLKRAGFR